MSGKLPLQLLTYTWTPNPAELEKPIRSVRKNRNGVRCSRAEFSPHADVVKDLLAVDHPEQPVTGHDGQLRFVHFSISTATKTRPATAAASVSSTALRGSVLKTPFSVGT